jgi:flagellar biosynthesis regulator FlbT
MAQLEDNQEVVQKLITQVNLHVANEEYYEALDLLSQCIGIESESKALLYEMRSGGMLLYVVTCCINIIV